jgi:hypothetical protein
MTKNNINQESWQPVYISGGSFDAELLKLESYYSRPKIIDQCETNLKELFLLRNPKYKFDKNYKGELEEFVSKMKEKPQP